MYSALGSVIQEPFIGHWINFLPVLNLIIARRIQDIFTVLYTVSLPLIHMYY
jgi:hypothetical protein